MQAKYKANRTSSVQTKIFPLYQTWNPSLYTEHHASTGHTKLDVDHSYSLYPFSHYGVFVLFILISWDILGNKIFMKP